MLLIGQGQTSGFSISCAAPEPSYMPMKFTIPLEMCCIKTNKYAFLINSDKKASPERGGEPPDGGGGVGKMHKK